MMERIALTLDITERDVRLTAMLLVVGLVVVAFAWVMEDSDG